ncbi:hypothetical protein OIU76_029572 [Salix suchowensis]|nr:hypothetical protein OIU76_029572 [Salix suchowensis]KAJ6368156.1 hypothetical protein OIU78_000685 [Salix suchowensis]KAJ6396418.1 hypothetical protein OIU77_021452 [Salix suchowensis]
MGNYVSCTLSNPQVFKNSSRSTRVILPSGEIKKIQQPTKAAELMLEAPNFFIVNAKSLKIGRRFCPLNADDELGKANVYAMFPMHKKNYVVTAGDMGALFVTANSVLKRASSKGNIRVLPEYTTEISQNIERNDVDAAPRLSLEEIEELSSPYFIHRMSISRSKKPLLETIEEEPVRSK